MKILTIGASTALGVAVIGGAEFSALNNFSKEPSMERPSVVAPPPDETQDGPEPAVLHPELRGFTSDGDEIRAVLDAHLNIAATGVAI